MTVKDPSIKLNQTEATLTVNETVKLTATTAPKSAASTVTYTTSNDKVATVAADGTVTAVGAGDATITASAKVGSKNPSKTAKITVKKVALQSVKQTKLKTIEAVVAGKTDDLKKDDFKLQNKTTGVQITVDSILVDKVDPTKVTINTTSEMQNSNDIDVTLDGVTKSFKATDGKIAGLSITPTTIRNGVQTEINVVTKDANGVELKTTKGTEVAAKTDYTLDVKPAKSTGYFAEGKLYLADKGDTATAKAEYATGEIDTATGKMKVISSGDVTITAGDPEVVALSNVAIRFSSTAGMKYADLKDNAVIAKTDTRYAAVQIKNAKNEEVDYAGYYLESSNNNVLIIDNKDLVGSVATVKLVAVNTGTATILVKDKVGNTVGSFPVTVKEERKINSLKVNHDSITVTSGAAVDLGVGTRKVKFTGVDQYGEDMASSSVADLEFKYAGRGTTDDQATDADAAITGEAGTYTMDLTNLKVGTYTYEASINGQGNHKVFKKVTVNVKRPTGKKTYKLALVDADGFETTRIDTTITSANAADVVTNGGINAQVMVLEYDNGAVSATTDGVITVDKKAFDNAKNVLPGTTLTTGGSITTGTGAVTDSAITFAAITVSSGAAVKADSGAYKFTCGKIDGKTVDSLTFNVSDTQTPPTFTGPKGTITADTVQNESGAATVVKDAFEFKDYDGSTIVDGDISVPDKGFKSVVGGIYVSKVTVTVTVRYNPDKNGEPQNSVKVPVTFDFNQYITQK